MLSPHSDRHALLAGPQEARENVEVEDKRFQFKSTIDSLTNLERDLFLMDSQVDKVESALKRGVDSISVKIAASDRYAKEAESLGIV